MNNVYIDEEQSNICGSFIYKLPNIIMISFNFSQTGNITKKEIKIKLYPTGFNPNLDSDDICFAPPPPFDSPSPPACPQPPALHPGRRPAAG